LLKTRGDPTNDLPDIARQHAETPFIFDSIAFRSGVNTVGPSHTGIILGYDTVKCDAIAFEKNGKDPPEIRYWSEIQEDMGPESQYVTWAPMQALAHDIEKGAEGYDEQEWQWDLRITHQ